MSTMLINEDFEDYLDGEDCKEIENLKCMKEDKNFLQKTKCLKERILILIAVGAVVNNFLQCAVLMSLTVTGNELTPKVTIYYITRDIVFLMSSPFMGLLVDHIGYEIPTLMGSVMMFLSTATLACSKGSLLFFFTRLFHGLASALLECSTLAALADLFKTRLRRYMVIGFVLEFAAFGYYSEASALTVYLLLIFDKTLFLIISLVPFVIGIYLFLVMMRLKKEEAKEFQTTKPNITPMWKLLVDPYIVLSAGALMIANIPLVFLQRTMNVWMENDVTGSSQANLMWYLFFSHGLGILSTVLITMKCPGYGWLITLGGLLLESLCCFGIPLIESYQVVEILVCVVAFAAGLVRCALLPNFAHIVDIRHVNIYGSVYSIANAFYSAGNVISPLVAYLNLFSTGFPTLIVAMGILNVVYAPILLYLRRF